MTAPGVGSSVLFGETQTWKNSESKCVPTGKVARREFILQCGIKIDLPLNFETETQTPRRPLDAPLACSILRHQDFRQISSSK